MRWLLLFSLCGCASVGVLQSPETLGRKNWEVGVELTAQGQVRKDAASVYPLGGISFRYGVADNVDLGARIGPGGLELDSKFMLTPRDSRVIVSLAPSLAGTFWVPSGIAIGTAQASLPMLIGVRLGPRVQLVIAPRLHDSVMFMSAGQAGGTVNTVLAGTALGFVIKVWRLKIIPDVGFLAPIATTTWRSDLRPGTAWGEGRWTVQGNLSFALGNSK